MRFYFYLFYQIYPPRNLITRRHCFFTVWWKHPDSKSYRYTVGPFDECTLQRHTSSRPFVLRQQFITIHNLWWSMSERELKSTDEGFCTKVAVIGFTWLPFPSVAWPPLAWFLQYASKILSEASFSPYISTSANQPCCYNEKQIVICEFYTCKHAWDACDHGLN